MSIRRQSCDTCFASRRKCDLTYPICTRCERNSKPCHYKYPPQIPKDSITTDITTIVTVSKSTGQLKRKFSHLDPSSPSQLSYDSSLILTPRWLGHLGKLAPITASKTWNWVFDQIRHCPQVFAERAETIFIHKSLHTNYQLPQPLRAAFGICTGTLSPKESNRQLVFHVLDSEVVSLLTSSLTLSLQEELYKLQAIVLYQIIRLFYGQIKERMLAERQEYLVRSYALKLLQLSNTELRDAPRTWEKWILAESIRRTVYIAFKLYTSYSMSRYGLCSEIQAMNMLPISTNSGLWYSNEREGRQVPVRDDVMTYKDFAEFYGRTPRRIVEPFERLIIVGCKRRIEQVDGIVCPRSRVEEIV
ncbi:Zn(2)-C6 fungal-type DNA-binding domain-containing protein [Pochonia chlamydosporia 170]|uniref:Zn(2)-C6 fungal-type DNA-binding domain-containing protein n=1 Tax=Pochonia chlamydosporia 170 TaxID=1380566 RepID=A0A179G4K8_METCM|nr:Zn(2)-C6 fungal-type DNA-binding domain-containing protein [Pochonia chlamydosporia 170]OAQ72792.1 Zn(2)-C6 fungal-type DNA-binding domain-containing protein [Pochonia chlamydosporia 170]